MRDELEQVLDLYEGMPLEGQEHWRDRSLPSIQFESDAEREEFVTALRERDKKPETVGAGQQKITPEQIQEFHPGQKVKVNLSGMQERGVSFSGNVEMVYATIRKKVSDNPPVYHVELLMSFRGISELDVPADRIRLL